MKYNKRYTYANQKLEFDKGLFVLKDDKKVIESDRVLINYYPEFIARFIKTEKGNYINVLLKNKIESSKNILEYLKALNFYDIKIKLEGRRFYFYEKNIK